MVLVVEGNPVAGGLAGRGQGAEQAAFQFQEVEEMDSGIEAAMDGVQ